MIEHVKLRARALQQQHRALFAGVFWFRAALTLLLTGLAAAGAVFLRGLPRSACVGGCAAVLLAVLGACSLGEARVFLSLANGRPASFRRFLSAFRAKDLLRAFASFTLGSLVRVFAGAILCSPACVCAALLFRALNRGLPVRSAVCFVCGAAAAAAATVPFLVCLHALFLMRAFFLATGCGSWRSVQNCLQTEERDLHTLLRLQRSFFGWRLLSLLLAPLPFVLGYAAQSRALLFSAMNLRRTT